MIIATTNHLDKVNSGLSKRTSRFDRKYKLALLSNGERTMYCAFWRRKLKENERVVFMNELYHRIAEVVEDFSFAYMKEAFVALLLLIARREDDDELDDEFEEVREHARNQDDDAEDLVLWREMKK
jgi:transitional endoplasmic reticulum ATPase